MNAPSGGISLDLSRMDKVLAVNAEDLDCVIEPGITREALNAYLRDTGLFFPIDPGANASLGGMAATRASGTNAVRYGTMRDNVIGLTAVMADGRIIRTARRAKKTSAGYDLTRLIVGSEGTLGIITKLNLKLYGIPEAILSGVCAFPSVRAACDTVIQTIQTGIPVARIELLDAQSMEAANAYAGLDLEPRPSLFLEFHGSPASVAEQAETFGMIAAEHGGGELRASQRTEERAKLWKARHDMYWASLTLRPGAKAIATDVCVPLSRLADCIGETQARHRGERARSGRSSAMSATATSTSRCFSTWRTRARSTRPRPSWRGSPSGPWRWTAPAQASTASGRASAAICAASSGMPST